MKDTFSTSETIKSSLYQEANKLLSQDILVENSFQDMYGEDVDSILESNLFVDTIYTNFENRDLRLIFLVSYLGKIESNWKYMTFAEFLENWEKSHRCQRYVNDAKVSLALGLPDVIQGNRILREGS